MASPPQRLCTHDRNAGLKGPRHISGRDGPISPRHTFMLLWGGPFNAHHIVIELWGGPFRAATRPIDQLFERASELGGLHVIGVAAEAFVAPAGVRRVALRFSETAKSGKVPIGDVLRGQRSRERVAGEMRMAPRFRHGPDVGEPVDAMRMQQRDEVVERSRRMPDGENGHVKMVTVKIVTRNRPRRSCSPTCGRRCAAPPRLAGPRRPRARTSP